MPFPTILIFPEPTWCDKRIVSQGIYKHSCCVWFPFIVIRSLSDSADDAAAEDLERFYEVAAANSAALVHAMLELMAAETRGARR